MPEEILTETGVDWKEGIAEEHLSAISGFVKDGNLSVPELSKGYSELFGKMGNSVSIPTADSSSEELGAFYKKTGRPDTPDGYTKPALPEGETLDTDFYGKMATIAHGKGCSDALFTELSNGFLEHAVHLKAQEAEAEVAEFNRRREEADVELHTTHGADYDKNIELSKRAYTEYASDELKELLETDKWKSLRNEPAFINMMVDMGKKNMDDTFVHGDGQVERPKDNYVPNSPSSPEMYANMDGDEGIKARAHFRAKGHEYDRKD